MTAPSVCSMCIILLLPVLDKFQIQSLIKISSVGEFETCKLGKSLQAKKYRILTSIRNKRWRRLIDAHVHPCSCCWRGWARPCTWRIPRHGLCLDMRMFFHPCFYMQLLGHKSAATCNGSIKPTSCTHCWISAIHAQPIPACIWRASGAQHHPSNQSLVCCSTCHASILFLQCINGHLPTMQFDN